MHQSQQLKGPFSLEAGMVLRSVKLPQLLATTAQDGTDWMTCNQFDDIIVQSSMVIKFTSLEELTHSESEIINFLKVLYRFILKIHGNLERRWRFKKHQAG